jgi:hypothetical protein
LGARESVAGWLTHRQSPGLTGEVGRMFPFGWIETVILPGKIVIFWLLNLSDPFRLTKSGQNKIK